MTNILLQRYRQQASLLTGLKETLTIQRTTLSGSSAMQQNRLSGSIQSLSPAQQSQAGSLLETSFTSGGALASLSAAGTQVSQFANALGTNGEAQAGLRAFTTELTKNWYSTDTPAIMKGLRDLQENDTSLFASAFATAGHVASAGGNATSFMKTLTSLNTPEQQSAFVASISDIMKTEGTNARRTELTGSVMNTISEIQRATQGEEGKKAVDTFLEELRSATTNDERSQFVEVYHRRNPFIFYT
ncbi:MAG TPA: hypothetical protein PLY73_13565 [Candidatus Ozemobacteraceae bacterium]|nr:hypothetical protein [Candidatus Ozemobacteraceae bacterium]